MQQGLLKEHLGRISCLSDVLALRAVSGWLADAEGEKPASARGGSRSGRVSRKRKDAEVPEPQPANGKKRIRRAPAKKDAPGRPQVACFHKLPSLACKQAVMLLLEVGAMW